MKIQECIDRLDGHDLMHIVTNVDSIYSAEIKVKTANLRF